VPKDGVAFQFIQMLTPKWL